MGKKIIFLVLMIGIVVFAYGDKVSVLKEIINPNSVNTNGTGLFIADGYTIFVYDLNTFELKAKFGKKGQGPGEFIDHPQVSVYTDFVVINDSGKVSWFSHNGKLIEEIKISPWDQLFPVKDNFIRIRRHFDLKKRSVNVNVSLINKQMQKMKNIYNYLDESVDIKLSTDKKGEIKKMTPHYCDVLTDNGNIYIADSKKGFYIKILDYNGNNIKQIQINMEDIPVTLEHKKELIEKIKISKRWKLLKSNKFVFNKIFPKIKRILIQNEKIYVTTYKVRNKDNEFIVLDKNGIIIKRVFLPIENELYTFVNNTYYYLKENESIEEWELFKIEI